MIVSYEIIENERGDFMVSINPLNNNAKYKSFNYKDRCLTLHFDNLSTIQLPQFPSKRIEHAKQNGSLLIAELHYKGVDREFILTF